MAESKRRNLLEQKRQNPRSVEQRFHEQINVSTVLAKLPNNCLKNCLKPRMFLKECYGCKLCITTNIKDKNYLCVGSVGFVLGGHLTDGLGNTWCQESNLSLLQSKHVDYTFELSPGPREEEPF